MDKIAGEVVKGATNYDGGIYLLAIFAVVITILVGIWLVKSYIPNSKIKIDSQIRSDESSRINSAKLTEATIAMSTLVSENYKTTMESAARIERIEQDVARALNAAQPMIVALDKIAKLNPELQISGELGEMRGAIRPPEKRV